MIIKKGMTIKVVSGAHKGLEENSICFAKKTKSYC